MDKNFKQTSNFFKREGFYVILFICLCIAATIAAVVARNSKLVKNQAAKTPESSISQSNKEADEKLQLSMEKADQKEKTIEDAAAVQGKKPENIDIQAHKTGSTKVAANTKIHFSMPLKGKFTVAKQFMGGEDEAIKSSLPSGNTIYAENYGIEIKPETDNTVYAIADGVVEDVSFNDSYGEKVTIKHSNGIETVYANLSEDVSVNKNSKVKCGTAIGKIGGTDCRPGYGAYKDCLHFEVIAGSKHVNPVPTYVKCE